MTPEDIRLIQTTFAQVFPQKAKFGMMFYTRLFEMEPAIKGMFSTSMARQSEMLMQALALVVRGLRTDGALPPKAMEMAARHGRYGVTEAHYQTMGDALLWSLAETLGDAFDAPTEAAWRKAYDRLSRTMINAAAGASPGVELTT
ncbi:globin domain-containing protein [Dinoroseobacter sp. S375]|uniref:globin domain-containing protein n=1 Tax=Dinoroseobacter sp. S375 TaxID=3415136 RepID=UPI003C7DCD38